MGEAADRLAVSIDRSVGWHRLPTALGLAVLAGIRGVLRRRNLHDTSHFPACDLPPLEPPDEVHRIARTADGSYNDLDQPRMGMAGSRFGRNLPHEATFPETAPMIFTPNPRVISQELLRRREFVPATSVNNLVGAWLQFMIRDWFSHGRGVLDDPWIIEVAADDPWPGQRPLTVPRVAADPTRPAGSDDLPPTFVNHHSHWWDASQLYGSSRAEQLHLRTMSEGKLKVPVNGRHTAADGTDPATVPGFWLGLAMMHHLFILEHNAICDRLRTVHPDLSDEQLFQRARLVNAALIAKIHTVEWTPAVVSHPTTVIGLRANWYGIEGETAQRMFGRISDSEIVSGIVGGKQDHFGVPFALTEEFVAVYRMHPLIADDWEFRSVNDDALLQEATFPQLAGPHTYDVLGKHTLADLFYSFGISHPGLVSLHNFPRFLQEFERPDGQLTDLAATDILRTRELGVPRYNEFRRMLHLPPAKDFTSLTDNPAWAVELRRVYGGDIEKVDLMVGMYAEPKPAGFAFSDTAFRVFILMASRRLNSDRFLTDDFTPQVYTQAGLDWIKNNTMLTVLGRHLPELIPATSDVDNAFAPWTRTTGEHAR
ncbi:putative peroxidase [Catellatospora sp. IY07-71]|uniref:peroxidase family protein n=1 Tax=Catellatospora sp. IY07-71 TaxID=2728827 RepID=UPI001BB5C6C2|nr:peroxidase family protein [Catellatospora sp. IY07-71]BCJ75968.1 putative peroxidase [Catellatospora sp. IY07-71]